MTRTPTLHRECLLSNHLNHQYLNHKCNLNLRCRKYMWMRLGDLVCMDWEFMLVDEELVSHGREVGARRNVSNLDRERGHLGSVYCLGVCWICWLGVCYGYRLLCVLGWRFLESSIWYLPTWHFKAIFYMDWKYRSLPIDRYSFLLTWNSESNLYDGWTRHLFTQISTV